MSDLLIPVTGSLCTQQGACTLVDIKIDASALFSFSSVDSTTFFLAGFFPVIIFYLIGLKFGTILNLFRLL